MADCTVAINYVLQWEDAGLTGVITHTRDGLRTRYGIDEHYHPELTNSLFYGSMGSTPALEIAYAIYRTSYCPPLCIEEIQNQAVANKLLCLGVNVGIVTASKMLQDALCVDGDGHIGPITLHALENDGSTTGGYAGVLAQLREEAENHYLELVEKYPEKRVYLKDWMRRAAA